MLTTVGQPEPAMPTNNSNTPDTVSFLASVREDYRKHGGRAWHRPGFHAVTVHRLGVWQSKLPKPVRLPVGALYGALYFITRNFYGIELPSKTRAGRRLVIGHQGGIVVGEGVKIGDDCVIRQNVTIGAEKHLGSSPDIGDRVEIGAGAVLVGGISVGDDVIVGPNAVVTSDVPSGARVYAPPARIIRPGNSGETAGSDDGPLSVERGQLTQTGRKPSVEDLIMLIREEFDVQAALDGDTPLVSSGLVDSLNVARLVAALEDVYGVEIAGEELEAESLDTPAQIVGLIAARMQVE